MYALLMGMNNAPPPHPPSSRRGLAVSLFRLGVELVQEGGGLVLAEGGQEGPNPLGEGRRSFRESARGEGGS